MQKGFTSNRAAPICSKPLRVKILRSENRTITTQAIHDSADTVQVDTLTHILNKHGRISMASNQPAKSVLDLAGHLFPFASYIDIIQHIIESSIGKTYDFSISLSVTRMISPALKGRIAPLKNMLWSSLTSKIPRLLHSLTIYPEIFLVSCADRTLQVTLISLSFSLISTLYQKIFSRQ